MKKYLAYFPAYAWVACFVFGAGESMRSIANHNLHDAWISCVFAIACAILSIVAKGVCDADFLFRMRLTQLDEEINALRAEAQRDNKRQSKWFDHEGNVIG